MKRSLGSGFGVLAFLAFTIHSAYPPAAEHGAVSSTESAKQQRKQKSAAQDASTSQLPRLEGPWLATRSFFALSSRQLPPDNSATLSRSLARSQADTAAFRALLGIPREGDQIQSIVATVVNPMHTHLALLFDQQIEAIEGAAERQDWEFATQWLPWSITSPSADDSFDDRLAEKKFETDQEALPGVLVFRRRGSHSEFPIDCLLVFLVPETPTAGIAADPFNAAMNLAFAAGNNVGLLAPTFSGSFDSLTRLLQNRTDFKNLKRPVYSGTAASSELAKAFSKATNLQFHSAGSSSDADQQGFKQVLNRLGISPEHAAYLIEGESGYGNSFADKATDADNAAAPATKITTYRYPRDIANLRNAYRDGVADPTKDKSQTLVDFTLKDRSHGEDTVPVFSDTHTPVLQGALLSSINRDLRRNRIEIVYIAATNDLDTLFLARIIRRGAPDTRVLIDGGDLLFVPAAAQESISGTLFLSPYPLFLQGNTWLSSNDGLIQTFPSSNAQGVFIVTQQLLRAMKSGGKQMDAPGFEHFPPDSAKPFPGLWLLTLTRNGLEPLDWFENESDGPKNGNSSSWFDVERSNAPLLPLSLPNPSFGWSLTVSAFGGFAILVGFLILRANFANAKPVPLWFKLKEDSTASALALIGHGCSLSLPVLLLTLPAWQYFRKDAVWESCGLVGLAAAALLPLFCAGFTVVRRLKPAGEIQSRHKFVAGTILFGYIGFVAIWASCCFGQTEQSDLLFRYRALDPYSGASPAAPLLIFSLVFLLRSAMLLRRYSEVAWDAPHLSLPEDVKIHSYIRTHFEEVEDHIKSGIEKLEAGIRTPVAWRYALSGLLAIACLTPFWDSLRAFEQSPYSFSLGLAVTLVLLSIVVSCQDLIHLWLNLRAMLALLEVSPLRNAIGRVARRWPKQAVWALWRSISRQRLAAQMLLALHNRYQNRQTSAHDYNDFRRLSEIRFSAPEKDDPMVYEARKAYEDKCADIAAKILKEDLVPYWDESTLNDNGEPILDDLRIDEFEITEDDASKSGADFVALQFCNYILFAVRHTQRLAWSISTSLLLLILALASYHPQSPQLLGRIIVLAFIGFGAVICWVLAGMERNWVLSRIGRTKPGELNLEFWARLGSVVILPLSAVLVHFFPTLSGFLSNVVTPGMEALK